MKKVAVQLVLCFACSCLARNSDQSRQEAEYYVAAYALHYGVPIEFVRAMVEQESGWQRCPVSAKGAVGLMQLMPRTARKLHVQNLCDLNQNISGGVRYLAWLMNRFNGDLRLVAAAYYAGELVVERRGLSFSNADVVTYVMSVQKHFEYQSRLRKAEPSIKGRMR